MLQRPDKTIFVDSFKHLLFLVTLSFLFIQMLQRHFNPNNGILLPSEVYANISLPCFCYLEVKKEKRLSMQTRIKFLKFNNRNGRQRQQRHGKRLIVYTNLFTFFIHSSCVSFCHHLQVHQISLEQSRKVSTTLSFTHSFTFARSSNCQKNIYIIFLESCSWYFIPETVSLMLSFEFAREYTLGQRPFACRMLEVNNVLTWSIQTSYSCFNCPWCD